MGLVARQFWQQSASHPYTEKLAVQPEKENPWRKIIETNEMIVLVGHREVIQKKKKSSVEEHESTFLSSMATCCLPISNSLNEH